MQAIPDKKLFMTIVLNTSVDNDVISSLLSMPAVMAAMM